MAWFTYGEDTVSGQRWLTAQGPLVGTSADLIVYETLGGSFDDPNPSETNAVGTMTIDFTDCRNADLAGARLGFRPEVAHQVKPAQDIK